MRDIINATICENHFLKCATYSIARNGEGLTPCLSISVPVGLHDFWAYIDFKKPNGETFKTPRIDIAEGKINYNIPSAVLDADGILEVQVVFQNANGDIWKTYVKEFAVRYSINATDDIPDKQDFITEAQNLLDAISSTVDGGSVVEFVVVDELPTENIKNAIYLVPNVDEKEKNLFDEFIFINDTWEMIGSAGVEVDLAEYVKNTDYASGSKAGVVAISAFYGVRILADGGYIGGVALTPEQYKNANAYSLLSKGTLNNIKNTYVKEGLTQNDTTLTDEEKQAALNWLGGVQRVTDTSSLERVYAVGFDGTAKTLRASVNPLDSALVKFHGTSIRVGEPIEDKHAVPKSYVDNLISELMSKVATLEETIKTLQG